MMTATTRLPLLAHEDVPGARSAPNARSAQTVHRDVDRRFPTP